MPNVYPTKIRELLRENWLTLLDKTKVQDINTEEVYLAMDAHEVKLPKVGVVGKVLTAILKVLVNPASVFYGITLKQVGSFFLVELGPLYEKHNTTLNGRYFGVLWIPNEMRQAFIRDNIDEYSPVEHLGKFRRMVEKNPDVIKYVREDFRE